jgi:hypothetical protein
MLRFRLLFTSVPALALLLGCGPSAGNGIDSSRVISRAGAGGAGGAGGSMDDVIVTAPSGGEEGGAGGVAVDPTGSGPVDPSCTTCVTALGSNDPAGLCSSSQLRYDAILACACDGACAAACSTGAAGDCLAAWEGNAPLQCKVCLVSSTGCGASWSACLSDDGVASGTSGSGGGTSGAGGSACACDPALPLCPGGGSCDTPGPSTGAGDAACGSAQYCAPCCDPGDPCAAKGLCEVTKIAEVACAAGYECCSGVCTAGHCDGGCGILLSF